MAGRSKVECATKPDVAHLKRRETLRHWRAAKMQDPAWRAGESIRTGVNYYIIIFLKNMSFHAFQQVYTTCKLVSTFSGIFLSCTLFACHLLYVGCQLLCVINDKHMYKY